MYNDTTIGCLEYWSNLGYTVRLDKGGSISWYNHHTNKWYYIGCGLTN